MANYKKFDYIKRWDKRIHFIKLDRQTAFKYISLRFKQRDEGRAYFRMMCRVAVRSGYARYINFYNWVPEGSWVGGIQGLKSILSNETHKLKKEEVSDILNSLRDKGYLSLYLNGKKFEVGLVHRYTGDECFLLPDPPEKTKGRNGGSYYKGPVPVSRWNSDFYQEGVITNYNNAHDERDYKIDWNKEVETDMSKDDNLIYNYSNEGWVALPKAPFDERARMYQEKKDKHNRCERTKHLAERFSPCEAFLDLLSHTVFRDFENFFSWFNPCVTIDDGVLLTCRSLAVRWGWGKSEVQRFLKEHSEVFTCVMMPGNCGSVVFVNPDFLELEGEDKKSCFVPLAEDLVAYLREVVGEGHIDRRYANDYIKEFSFLFVKRYFCRGVFCPKGDALKQFVKLCQKEKLPIEDDVQFAPFTMENIHKVSVPREWKDFFGGPPELPEF